MKTELRKRIVRVFFDKNTKELEEHLLPLLSTLTRAGVIEKATDTTSKDFLKKVCVGEIKLPRKYSRSVQYSPIENDNEKHIYVDIIIEHDKKNEYDAIFQNFCKERNISS